MVVYVPVGIYTAQAVLYSQTYHIRTVYPHFVYEQPPVNVHDGFYFVDAAGLPVKCCTQVLRQRRILR